MLSGFEKKNEKTFAHILSGRPSCIVFVNGYLNLTTHKLFLLDEIAMY